MPFKSFRKIYNTFLHIPTILIITRINSQGKIRWYVTYVKMIKYANDTIITEFVLFKEKYKFQLSLSRVG
jgi:hypothetical protein